MLYDVLLADMDGLGSAIGVASEIGWMSRRGLSRVVAQVSMLLAFAKMIRD